jgi:UDP-4-amino-4,6-dideoxy-N-acetyl-beta-L-altrosamine transaminase
MINYGKQFIDGEDIKSVIKVLKSNYLTQGPKINEFENHLKKKFGSRHCLTVSSGTAALFMVSKALGWGKGDTIITSPITFLASANCIVNSGAKPDFVDIDEHSFNINVNKLENKLKKNKKIKAIIAVDYAGHPCDWKSLRYLANKYKIKLINDNCHALGAKYFNDIQYAIKYADIVTHSYHPVKTITTGEGGAILCNDRKLHNDLFKMRSHSMVKKKDNKKLWYYEINEAGFNFRITDIQCALGSSQLKKLDMFIKKRRKIASYYNKKLKDEVKIVTPKEKNNINHAYHLYPIQVDFKNTKITKENLFKKMRNLGINLQVHYIPIHLQPFYKKKFKFKRGDFKIAENFYEREISLPIYPSLTLHEMNKVIRNLRKLI